MLVRGVRRDFHDAQHALEALLLQIVFYFPDLRFARCAAAPALSSTVLALAGLERRFPSRARAVSLFAGPLSGARVGGPGRALAYARDSAALPTNARNRATLLLFSIFVVTAGPVVRGTGVSRISAAALRPFAWSGDRRHSHRPCYSAACTRRICLVVAARRADFAGGVRRSDGCATRPAPRRPPTYMHATYNLDSIRGFSWHKPEPYDRNDSMDRRGVVMIDQTRLPREESYVTCTDYEQVAEAIRSMVIRGAPAIGVAAAMGIALGMQQAECAAEFDEDLRYTGAHPSHRGESVLGHRADAPPLFGTARPVARRNPRAR